MQRLLACAGALLLAIASPAAALAEEDAGQHPLVERAWHEPADVEPGQQWTGHLRLRDGVAAANVSYQVCEVDVHGGVCFAPPHDATRQADGTWSFDTGHYLANGRPVQWGAGWLVGVRWYLEDGAGNGTWIPAAPDAQGPIASHYLTFRIPGEADRDAPAPGLATVLLAVVVAALAGSSSRRVR